MNNFMDPMGFWQRAQDMIIQDARDLQVKMREKVRPAKNYGLELQKAQKIVEAANCLKCPNCGGLNNEYESMP